MKNQAEALGGGKDAPVIQEKPKGGDAASDEEEDDDATDLQFPLIPSRPDFKIRDASHAVPLGKIAGATKGMLYTNKTLDARRETFVLYFNFYQLLSNY